MDSAVAPSGRVTIAQYLLERLKQLGAKSVFGVPGDYTLELLDYVEPAGMTWVGNATELCAGYAADGYARLRGISVLISAFGVGELSAINAIAGAYAERSPVVHIVGTPSTQQAQNKLCLHHSLGDGDFRVFASMYSKITVSQAQLSDATVAAAEIDRVLRDCVDHSRPVYLELPTDMVATPILSAPLIQPIKPQVHLNDGEYENFAVDMVLEMMYAANKPLIIVDGFVRQYGVHSEVDDLVHRTHFLTTVTVAGKGAVSELYGNVIKSYAGSASEPAHRSWVESCDLVIWLAPLRSDFNTFKFSAMPPARITVAFDRDSINIKGVEYRNLSIKPMLRKLLNSLDVVRLPKPVELPEYATKTLHLQTLPPSGETAIKQASFWPQVSKFLRYRDIVVAECGTSIFGAQNLNLPSKCAMIVSPLWLSIGYALGAAQGAASAQREIAIELDQTPGRCILFTGDGSLQISVQSISDIIRNRIDMTLFIINNDGYTIERYIHGMHASYNDIQPWKYLKAPHFLGAAVDDPNYPVVTRRIENHGQLNDAFLDPAVSRGKGLIMIEVIMGKEDAPDVLKKMFPQKETSNSTPNRAAATQS